ncbi:hypothetical protein [Clostridium perfringens]|uniref:hypothetical protein n=2 Tax=Clostridium perfringens TaxID=1502 RepID=UPI0011151483|nr:hypothetical protein [Clostridium perfringens]
MDLRRLVRSEEKEIKSIVYIDGKNNINVEYVNFDNIKNNFKDFVVVYKPNKKQREIVREYLAKYMGSSKENLSKLANNNEFIFILFKELTDLFSDKFDIKTNKEDMETWKSIMNNPSDLFLVVNQEIDQISNEILITYIKNIQELNRFPKEIRKDIVTNMVEIQKQNKLKQEEAKLKIERDKAKKEYEDMIKKVKEYEEKYGDIVG